tara:strand:+ start:1348 stop:1752 length:405 start_codon:yes stop_codon:yes gene_type:complete
MKYLLLLLLPLVSCSKDTEPGVFEIGVWEQQNINTMSFVIDIETEPFAYDEDFYIELIMVARPITDLSSEEEWIYSMDQPIYHKSVVLTCQDFMLCEGKLVYSLGHQFEQEFDSSGYFLDYEVATEHEYIERVD